MNKPDFPEIPEALYCVWKNHTTGVKTKMTFTCPKQSKAKVDDVKLMGL